MIAVKQEFSNEAALIQTIDILTKKLVKEKQKSDVMRKALVRITGLAASPNPSAGKVSMESNGALLAEEIIEKTGKI
jgi:hypothetical protein